jgi:phosphopantothenoylcysteine decarboxylase/phosphopantothenate--cysteine ligase
MKILLTSGGTKIPIDMVRSITNMSKGTFGSAICKSFLEKDINVDFLMAEGSRTPFELRIKYPNTVYTAVETEIWLGFVHRYAAYYREYVYKTFDDYKKSLEELLSQNKYDIVILAAAVSDYEVKNVVQGKIRSSEDNKIELSPLPKLIKKVKELNPDIFLVGFKLLVNSTDDELIQEAKKSIEKNNCDVVVANDLRDIRQNNHKLLIVTKNDANIIGKDANIPLANKLVEKILILNSKHVLGGE